YSDAWRIGAAGQVAVPSSGHIRADEGSILLRFWKTPDLIPTSGFNQILRCQSTSNEFLLYVNSSGLIGGALGASAGGLSYPLSALSNDTYHTIRLSWKVGARSLMQIDDESTVVSASTLAGPVQLGPSLTLGLSSTSGVVVTPGAVIYPQRVPPAELARLASMPAAWTMQNTAVNMALQSQPPAGSPFLQMHPPNRKIGTGGATLRTAPGPSTQAITTLAAGTDVHDTKTTVSVS